MHKTCEIMNSTCDVLIHKLSLFVRPFSCVFFFILVVQLVICIITFLVVFNICIERILSELSFFLVYARHMRTATLIFKLFSQSVISFARFSASILSSFIDVSLCSVDAAHMHSRGLFDQMSIFLWPRLMLLAYASHRPPKLFQPDVKNFFQSRLNFSNPPAEIRVWQSVVDSVKLRSQHG